MKRIKYPFFISLLFFLICCGDTTQKEQIHPEGLAKQSISIHPRGDSPYVDVHVEGLEGKVTLQMPELVSDRDHRLVYAFSNLEKGIQWQRQSGGEWLSYWRQEGLAFYELVATPESDGLRIDWTIKNLSSKTWFYSAGTVCMRSHEAPLFFDPTLERTYLHAEDRWIALQDVVRNPGNLWFLPPGKEPCNLMRPLIEKGNWSVVDSIQPDEAIMAILSSDGRWVLAQAWHEARYMISNTGLDRMYACTDVSPFLGDIAPGQTVRIRGKIYIFRGGLDDLVIQYKADLKNKKINRIY